VASDSSLAAEPSRAASRGWKTGVCETGYSAVRIGAPWADIPERYGPHTTGVNRFNRWRKAVFGRGRTLLAEQRL